MSNVTEKVLLTLTMFCGLAMGQKSDVLRQCGEDSQLGSLHTISQVLYGCIFMKFLHFKKHRGQDIIPEKNETETSVLLSDFHFFFVSLVITQRHLWYAT